MSVTEMPWRAGFITATRSMDACAAAFCLALVLPVVAGAQEDPFGGLQPTPAPLAVSNAVAKPDAPDVLTRLLGDNAQARTEVFSQFSFSDDTAEGRHIYSRQSIGLEVVKRFAGSLRTWGLADVQARLVRRDNYVPVINDMEGADHDGWSVELHNCYIDFYNVLNPLLSDKARGEQVGRFNVRLGRFYLPFGLNLQTDTHGTLLQLSNDRNFGFERDWYAGLFGGLCRDVNYDLHYLSGAGNAMRFEGQSGLAGARLSLGSRWANEFGVEGGISLLAGERVSEHGLMASPSVASESEGNGIVATRRGGLDVRCRRVVPGGTLTYTTEWSAGRDESDDVLTQLHQLDYLHRSRKWGLGVQYRRFWQDIGPDPATDVAPGSADASLVGEATWYLLNDVGNANLQWVKINVELQTERQEGSDATVVSVQYYRYW